MSEISWSLRPGITGPIMTPVLTPARLSASIALIRLRGLDARGSSLLASAGSRLVTDTCTAATSGEDIV